MANSSGVACLHFSNHRVLLMSRAVYPFALCLTLGLLATMWLRPGLAQELIEMASRIRAQSPDRYGSTAAGTTNGATPQDPFTQLPYDSVSRPPMQPVPVTRPVAWPGTSAQASGAADPRAMAPATPPASGGVTVWDPSAGRYVSPVNTAPQYVAQAPPPNGVLAQPSYAPAVANTTPAGIPAGNPFVQQPNLAPAAAPPPNGQLPVVPNLEAQNLQVWPGPPKDLPDAQQAAKIGTEAVLIGDLKAMASDAIFRSKMQIPPDQLELAYTQACRPLLKQLIETKLIYNDALHTIPKEALPKIEADLAMEFDKTQLPKLFESHGVTNVQELDRKMRERGSSLDFMRRSFFEKSMAQGWLQQKIKFKEEVPHSDVLGYYKSHLADYEFPAKARWEELMVRFDKFPDKASAWAAIAQLGAAVQNGAPFAETAKANSHGLTAPDGGQWDWTTKNSLASKIIDDAIFGLPVGALSQIIETDRGFHIVRVIERTEAGRKKFIDVQPEIKKQIKQEKLQKQIEDYLSEIRARTPIQTMYDNEPGGLEGPQQEQERRSVFE
jgi:hypothetical protein